MSRRSPPPPPAPLDLGDVSDLLQRFVEGSSGSAEATVDDLVRVRVASTMNVVSVELLASGLDPDMKQRLETAIVGAVNTALQRVALAAGSALAELEREAKRPGAASAFQRSR